MQALIDIDDELLRKARGKNGERSESELVAEGLRLLVQMQAQQELRQLRGKIEWHGDVEASVEGMQSVMGHCG